MSTPRIGLSTGWTEEEFADHPLASNRYAKAVIKAGGDPFYIPIGLSPRKLKEIFDQSAGILLRGGGDMDPSRYGVVPSKLTNLKEINHERDSVETTLTLLAVESGKTTLGICRGIQVMNVALGGKLYQDVMAEMSASLPHDQHKNPDGTDKPRDLLSHEVRIEPDNLLSKATGLTKIRVNSLHHQGIRQLSGKLKAIGIVPEDNLVEAIEMPGHPFFLGVQWHPEELMQYSQHQGIFSAFVDHARRSKD